MKIMVISDEDTNIMFQLLGLDSYVINTTDSNEFIKEFDKILEDPEIGVIIMNEKYLLRHRDYFKKIKLQQKPIIVEIPDISAPIQEDYFKDFILRYIGFSYSENV